jgi:hypothetical protein
LKIPLLFIAALLLLDSCNEKEKCEDILLAVEHFECENSKHTLIVDLSNDYTIIRSKEQYDNMVSGSCHPEINFSNFDLVIGKQSSGNWNDTIIYDLRKTCPENELTLTIEIIQMDITIPDNVVYHAMIPKLGDEETLIININSH